MYVKVSMRPIERHQLSELERKRCRTIARGRPWDVWEEDIWWWSLDRQSWHPLDEALWPRRRRWLMVELDNEIRPAFTWEVGQEEVERAEEPTSAPSRTPLPW